MMKTGSVSEDKNKRTKLLEPNLEPYVPKVEIALLANTASIHCAQTCRLAKLVVIVAVQAGSG